MQNSDSQIVTIRYKNYRGEIGIRTIIPIKIWFGATEYHPEPQWILDAHDVEKNALRSFALKDISSWK